MSPMHSTVVINVVGLTPNLLGPHTPHLQNLARQGALQPLSTITPAVTCSVQSTFTTGLPVRDHGIVANGWYFRDLHEVKFWRQSNRLVQGEKIWETGVRLNPSFTCAKLFWWFNMYSSAQYSVTPRPVYPADGRKIPDIYTQPSELRQELNQKLGSFPLFRFWGPTADLVSSRWITDCALHMYQTYRPTLTLMYLPLLDYNLQRLGPDHEGLRPDLKNIDALCGEIIDGVQQHGTRVIILSEYGVTKVQRPVHINRALRQAGLLRVREELGHDMLDCGASDAFAVADHQIAHIYIRSPDKVKDVQAMLQELPGIEWVLDAEGKQEFGLDHPRSGELVAISRPEAWFTYYFWLDDGKAPDYARTVDIHRKPGYDPVELFLNPNIAFPKLRLAKKFLEKTLGFRTLFDLIGLDASLPQGSHGRITDTPEQGPLFISSEPDIMPDHPVPATQVKTLILQHVFGKQIVRGKNS